jgi:hypothetical protein
VSISVQCGWVEDIFPPRRVIPELVLVELLEARDVQKGIVRCPEISVVTTLVLFHNCIELMVGHLKSRSEKAMEDS